MISDVADSANTKSIDRPEVSLEVAAWKDYLALTKPEISFLVAISALAGFVLGSDVGAFDFLGLIGTMVGTTLAAAGACAMNHVLEHERDAKMKRTANRPIPSGRVTTRNAKIFAYSAVALGVAILCPLANALTALLALATVALYIWVYTPMKVKTSWNTIVGTIPGALPALGGYVAATGGFGATGWVIFAVLVFWQLPHFYALAWMYRKDYGRGEFKMLSVADDSGIRTTSAALAGTALLVVVSAMPYFLEAAGIAYLIGAIVLGAWFFSKAVLFAAHRSTQSARRLLKASVVYIPLYVLLLLVDFVA